jgi:hypothetical protein
MSSFSSFHDPFLMMGYMNMSMIAGVSKRDREERVRRRERREKGESGRTICRF